MAIFGTRDDKEMTEILENTLARGTRFGWDLVNAGNRHATDDYHLYDEHWLCFKKLPRISPPTLLWETPVCLNLLYFHGIQQRFKIILVRRQQSWHLSFFRSDRVQIVVNKASLGVSIHPNGLGNCFPVHRARQHQISLWRHNGINHRDFLFHQLHQADAPIGHATGGKRLPGRKEVFARETPITIGDQFHDGIIPFLLKKAKSPKAPGAV